MPAQRSDSPIRLSGKRIGQADDAVAHPRLVDVAAVEEGRPLALDDGRAEAGDEAVDGRAVERHALAQPVDGEALGRLMPPHHGDAPVGAM